MRGDADGGVAAGGRTSSSGGEDGYERAIPSHGDEFAHKLISAVQKNPGQILRQGLLSSLFSYIWKSSICEGFLIDKNYSSEHCELVSLIFFLCFSKLIIKRPGIVSLFHAKRSLVFCFVLLRKEMKKFLFFALFTFLLRFMYYCKNNLAKLERQIFLERWRLSDYRRS